MEAEPNSESSEQRSAKRFVTDGIRLLDGSKLHPSHADVSANVGERHGRLFPAFQHPGTVPESDDAFVDEPAAQRAPRRRTQRVLLPSELPSNQQSIRVHAFAGLFHVCGANDTLHQRLDAKSAPFTASGLELERIKLVAVPHQLVEVIQLPFVRAAEPRLTDRV